MTAKQLAEQAGISLAAAKKRLQRDKTLAPVPELSPVLIPQLLAEQVPQANKGQYMFPPDESPREDSANAPRTEIEVWTGGDGTVLVFTAPRAPGIVHVPGLHSFTPSNALSDEIDHLKEQLADALSRIGELESRATAPDGQKSNYQGSERSLVQSWDYIDSV